MNFKPQVKVNGEWAGNALVFATYDEAYDNARDLMGRWMLVEDYGVKETDDPVNYKWTAQGLVEVSRKCPQCDGAAYRSPAYCGAWVCEKCGNHLGLARCHCGWAASGGGGDALADRQNDSFAE
jgi:hypothetical protein